ncbi:phage/plasmid primase, P4 family [Bacillus sp. CGMCC 1.16607]|uniref:phage/plasmid primase, P4 family n=1 Tax=Bacillus sp. CGMCC 1.16607 TaxID=3351842 RepID=UPI003628362C
MTLLLDTLIKAPDFTKIPEELKQIPQWVLWKSREKTDKNGVEYLTKEPCSLDGKMDINWTDKKNWNSFDTVKKVYEQGGFNGVGIVINGNNNLVCVDLDDFKDINNIPAEKYNLTLYSYTEKSPSGNGLHIWIEGVKPSWVGTKKNGVEFFGSSNKFLTVTGDVFTDLPVKKNQKLINYIADKYFQEDKKKSSNNGQEVGRPSRQLDDDTVLNKMFNAKNGKKIADLFNGSTSSSYSSDSEADLAMCNYLAYWTNGNAEQMDRLFRRSALYRAKWDKKNAGSTYGLNTIEKALSSLKINKSISDSAPTVKDTTKKNEATTNYFEGKTFIPSRLARDIMKNLKMIFDGSQLYLYENGVYRGTGEMIVRQEAMKKLVERFKKSHVTETIYYIETATYKEVDNVNKDDRFINVKNGLLDWRTGELNPHDPNIFTTIQLPVEYNPAAQCPNINHFLQTTVPIDTIPMLLEWFGYSMIPSTRFQKALMLTGSGNNGKSIFIDLFQRFLGTDNLSNIPLQDLEHNRFKLAQLYGKLANVFADIPATALDKSSIFKTVVTGDRVSAEFKGRDSFDFKPFSRLLFSANELPRSSDLTHGFFRRWLIVPFPHKFGEGGKPADINLLDKVTTKEELSGLLNLAIEGLRRLDKQKSFTVNETTTKATEDYKKEIDNVATFLDEMCIIGENQFVEKQKIYNAYDRWCFDSGYKPLGKIKFFQRLEGKVNIVSYRSNSKAPWNYRNIGLLTAFS